VLTKRILCTVSMTLLLAIATVAPTAAQESTPPPEFAARWTSQQVVDGFVAAGLECADARPTTDDDFAFLPYMEVEGQYFTLPSLCSKCGGQVLVFADWNDLQVTRTHYELLGKSLRAFRSWVFVRDNVLVQMNRDVDAARAREYESALLALTEAPVATSPPPVATPSQHGVSLVVDQYITTTTSWGSLYVIGDLINQGDSDAMSVEMAVSLLDADGAVLALGSYNSIDLGIAKAGSKYPFRIGIDDPPAEWADVSIQMDASPFDETEYYWPYSYDFALEGVTANAKGSEYVIAGRVVNEGQKATNYVVVIGAIYDLDGKILDADSTSVALDVIRPGKKSPFKLKFSDLKDEVGRYVLYVQGTETD